MLDHSGLGLKALTVTFVLLLVLCDNLTLEQQLGRLRSPIERQALLSLRSLLGLRSREWPRKADPCLVWIGVQCENGSVVQINISGFRRTRVGSLNPQFAIDSIRNLTNLKYFNASRFLLPGSIPGWLGQNQSLLSLQVLDFRFCNISNGIPGSLGNLTGLTALYLSDNRLVGTIPSSLGQLWSLSVLDLARNSFTGSIPVSFSSLGNLTRLDVSSNFLFGMIPPGIGTLAKLQNLNVSGNSLSSSIPSPLGDLGNLVDLDLSYNSFTGVVPEDLRGLRNLQRLLIGNNFLGGSFPASLFRTATKLQVIVLKNNNFSGQVPDVLWSLPSLISVDISSNNFTGVINSSFNGNTTSSYLNISGNLFYGGLSQVFRRFGSIDLSGNFFEGKVSDYVPENASLTTNCLQNLSNQRTLSECQSFYAERGLVFDNFGQPNTTQPPPPGVTSGKSNKRVIILASVLGGVGLLVLLVLLLLLLLCIRKRGNGNNHRGVVGIGSVPAGSSPTPPPATINFSSLGDTFTYQQLVQATNNFNEKNLIKHGHSGDLYKGVLENGTLAVIKKVDLQSTKDSYLSELEFFGKVSHNRIIPFLGHCLDNENEKFLVYKYMPNGDLSSSLYRKTSSEDDSLQSLDWITRLKIAIGAAEGLSCLHHDCTPPFVHRDVQASSILLDDKFEVRLGSLSEVCAQEGESHQSKITRLLRLPQSSEGTSGLHTAACANDVYCFGKVLLELVTGKLGVSSFSEAELKEWLEHMLPYISIYEKELVTKIIDPSLIIDEDLLEEVWAMAIVARSCLNPKPSRRPLMRYILKALENPLKVVREEQTGSARLKATSSRAAWNTALFGSWRSTSDLAVIPGASGTKPETGGSFKHSGTSNSSGNNNNNHGGEHSSSRRRHSREICPEPYDVQDVERHEHDY